MGGPWVDETPMRNLIYGFPTFAVYNEEVDPYVDNFVQRRDFFDFLKSLVPINGLEPLNATSLGIAMVAPIKRLNERKDNLKPGRRDAMVRILHEEICENASCFLAAFVTKLRWPLQANASESAVEQCRSRYNNRCLITGAPDPEVTSIFPFAGNDDFQNMPIEHAWYTMRAECPQSAIHDILDSFWGETKAAQWEKLFHYGALSASRNLICFSPQFNRWWHEARFALKPLRKLARGFHVQFYWLKPSPFARGEEIQERDVFQQAGLDDPEWGRQPSGTLPVVKTGQIFAIRANEFNELPDLELMELQWDFMRIAAIACGAQLCEGENGGDGDS